MKTLFSILLVTVTLFSSCKKKEPVVVEPIDNPSTTNSGNTNPPAPVTAPCNPDTNKIKYGGFTLTYTYVGTTTNGLSYGNWGIFGNGSNSDLYIEFVAAPSTGMYFTNSSSSLTDPKKCQVYGIFGFSLGQSYTAVGGDSVYVNDLGNGNYSVSFCSLTFNSSQAGPFTSHGNLTKK